jgi:hypothetical protein
MESIAIFPVSGDHEGSLFRAVARTGQSEGRTAGEALDAISPTLPSGSSGTMVVIQSFRPDEFFGPQETQRLQSLMDRLRAARCGAEPLSSEEQAELERLVEAEWKAAACRTQALLQGSPG